MALYHPEVPSCRDCQKWMYDRDWRRIEKWRRTDEGLKRLPIARSPGHPLPCGTCPKSGPQDGRPHPEKELSWRNQRCFLHYLECKATGSFPDDPIVRRNAGLIRSVEDLHERQKGMLPLMLAGMLAKK